MQLSELGDALRKARKERHLTLKELASQSGLHFTTLSALERGAVSELGVRKIMRVAETLGFELVLRPAGQSYTLDDVAKERNATPDNPALGRYAADKLTAQLASANKLAEHMNSLNKFNELQKAQESFSSANKLAEQMRSFEEVNRLQKAQEPLTSSNKLNEQLKSFNKLDQLQTEQESLTRLLKQQDLLDRVLGKK